MSLSKHRLLSTWVHNRSLRSPGRLARLALRPHAVGRLRVVDYVESLGQPGVDPPEILTDRDRPE
jgi:hypothetical protein